VIDSFRDTSSSTSSSSVSQMPKIAYMVIQKDGISKFIVKDRNDSFGSPYPGVVINKDALTGTPTAHLAASKDQKPWSEFFLISTYNTQSTAKPIHCYTIYDSTGWKQSDNGLQQLCFTLCHLYPNWCSSTRVPCVTRAAHRVAELVGRLARGSKTKVDIHPSLKKTFWYL